MIGELFTISATNIGHAALPQAAIPVGSSVDVRLVPVARSGDEQVGMLVDRDGYRQVVPISEAHVKACVDAGVCEETQRYVDELADQVRAAAAGGEV